MAYPREVFKSDQYLVIWSDEEAAAMKAKGWRDDKDIPDAPPVPEIKPAKRSFPMEIYSDGKSMVVFSGEERVERIRQGWSDEPVPVKEPDPAMLKSAGKPVIAPKVAVPPPALPATEPELPNAPVPAAAATAPVPVKVPAKKE